MEEHHDVDVRFKTDLTPLKIEVTIDFGLGVWILVVILLSSIVELLTK